MRGTGLADSFSSIGEGPISIENMTLLGLVFKRRRRLAWYRLEGGRGRRLFRSFNSNRRQRDGSSCKAGTELLPVFAHQRCEFIDIELGTVYSATFSCTGCIMSEKLYCSQDAIVISDDSHFECNLDCFIDVAGLKANTGGFVKYKVRFPFSILSPETKFWLF